MPVGSRDDGILALILNQQESDRRVAKLIDDILDRIERVHATVYRLESRLEIIEEIEKGRRDDQREKRNGMREWIKLAIGPTVGTLVTLFVMWLIWQAIHTVR